MDLITSSDPRYDEARTLHNAMIDKRPAAIAACASPQDVVEALAHGRSNNLDVAVRAGGHSVAGMSVNDDGIVIDVRGMKAIAVDPDRKTVTCGAGVTWGEFDQATTAHGLLTTGGRVSTTGVAGLTLGGGSGWFERKLGLSCDNLVSVDLVTAGGRQVTASDSENPELFWALHGGGGNFGVATAFEFRLHAIGPIVTAGLMLWPADAAEEVARSYRDVASGAPDEFGFALGFLTGPPEEFVPVHLQGATVVAVVGAYAGDPAEGESAVKPFRDLRPEVDLVGPMPYADFQCMIDDPPGFHNYWTADYHDDFPDEALDVFIKAGRGLPSPMTQQLMVAWGGAVGRVPDDATPLNKRDSKWITHPFAMWEDPADTDACISWARRFRDDIARYTNGGIYLNFIGNEGEDRIRAAFGEAKYKRLQAVKGEYDPENVFRGNQNIKPA